MVVSDQVVRVCNPIREWAVAEVFGVKGESYDKSTMTLQSTS
jgi:hypothetical protein